MDIERWLTEYNKPKNEGRGGEQDSIKWVDRYDREDIEDMAKSLKPFKAARAKLCGVVPETGGHATSDAIMSFLRYEPDLFDMEQMDPRYFKNRAVIAEVMKSPEWERLRSWTVGDPVNTAMSFCDIEPMLEQFFDKVSKEEKEGQKRIEELRKELEALAEAQRDLDQLMEDWKAGGAMDPDFDPDATEDGQSDIAERMGQVADELGDAADAAAAAAAAAAAEAMPGIRTQMGDSADKAESLANMAMGFGQEPGELKRMPAEQRIKLAQKLEGNKKFEKLAELIGPMMRLASAEQTRKVYHSFEEIYDVGLGGDLNRIVPSEYLNFLHPKLKLIFLRRMAERELLQYELRGTEKVGKGGIIMATDNSGSMMGDPEMWSKAVGLALMAIAKDQKRSFYGMHFSSRSQLMTFDFREAEDMTLERVIDYAEFFYGGGTDFVRPLSEALKLLQDEEKEKGHTEGDIVFVTDGMCSVPDEWLKQFVSERDRLGFKVWGVAIGCPATSEPLNTICEGNVVTITDLLTGENVREMFRAV